MADTTTLNLGLTKPEPLAAAGANLWGPKLNTDFDLIDAIFAALGTGTSVGMQVGTGKSLKVTGTGELNVASGATLVLKGTTISALTSFVATILDDASAGAVRTTLGIDSDDAVTFGSVTVAADPTTALMLATKQYVDSLAVNVGKRATVRFATTANDTLSGLAARDGVTPVAGNLALVKSNTASAENGVYVAAAGAWARDAQFDTFNEHPGALIAVQEGTANADTLWLCTANTGGTLGTTAITFSKMVIAGELLAANNLSDVANAVTALSNIGGQPLDATLTALAGANWAANALPIGSGADTLAQIAFAANTFPARASTGDLVAKPISDAALTVLDDASTAAMRTTLGLAIGTDVQAFDATLAALAGLTIAADSLSIGTGADAFTQTAFGINTFPARASTGSLVAKAITDFGLSLVDDATAAAARTTLGVDGAPFLLSTTTISNVATVDLPFTAGYKSYEMHLINVVPVTGDTLFQLRTSADAGVSYAAGAADYEWRKVIDGATNSSLGDTRLECTGPNVTTDNAGGGLCGVITIFDPLGTAHKKMVQGKLTHRLAGGHNVVIDFAGLRDDPAALTHIRAMFSSGNLEIGIIKWYGLI